MNTSVIIIIIICFRHCCIYEPIGWGTARLSLQQ